MYLLLRWLLSALALIAIAYYVPGIVVTNFYAALVAALVLGLVNALIRPIILVLTLPFNVITLGLFTLVINALMFWFASTLVKGFNVAGFWPAFWGAMAMWLCNWLIASLLRSDRK
jgi:putative membrane protein